MHEYKDNLFKNILVFSFRLNLDSGAVIYDQPNLSSLPNKIKSVQYNAALAITVVIRGTSKEKLLEELDFESLKDRRWLKRLCYLQEIISTKLLLTFFIDFLEFWTFLC